MQRSWPFVVLALASVSCASGPHGAQMTHMPDPSVPKCAGNPTLGCISTPNCQYDEKHGCEACVCSPVMQSPAQVQAAPFGTP